MIILIMIIVKIIIKHEIIYNENNVQKFTTSYKNINDHDYDNDNGEGEVYCDDKNHGNSNMIMTIMIEEERVIKEEKDRRRKTYKEIVKEGKDDGERKKK